MVYNAYGNGEMATICGAWASGNGYIVGYSVCLRGFANVKLGTLPSFRYAVWVEFNKPDMLRAILCNSWSWWLDGRWEFCERIVWR